MAFQVKSTLTDTPIGSQQRSPRVVNLFAKDFTNADEGIPVPVIFGRVRRSGIHITPVFKFRSIAITQAMGK